MANTNHSLPSIRSIFPDLLPPLPPKKTKKHKCAVCEKAFSRPAGLKTHMRKHTGATPFRCPYPSCERHFSVNSNMRRHYRNHEKYNHPASNQHPAPAHSSHGTSMPHVDEHSGISADTSQHEPSALHVSYSTPSVVAEHQFNLFAWAHDSDVRNDA